MVQLMSDKIIDWIVHTGFTLGFIFAFVWLLSGCSIPALDPQPLDKCHMEKITMWGVGAVVVGAPIGAFFYHRERGLGVISETSPDPSLPKLLNNSSC